MTLELQRFLDEHPKGITLGDYPAPVPVNTGNIGDIKFEVYRAKRMDSPNFEHQALEKLVEKARGSYRIYGEVPPIDGYDLKSAIYLVSTTFPLGGEHGQRLGPEPLWAQAWYTLRFVPVAGEPPYNEDLHFYVYQNEQGVREPIWNRIRQMPELVDLEDEEISQRVVAQSRYAVVKPYFLENIDNPGTLLNLLLIQRKQANKAAYGGISFALMNQQFYKDYPDTRLMTGQLHHDLSDELLAYTKRDGNKITMPFTPASTILEVDPTRVKIDRDGEGVYALDVPGYFLELSELATTLKCLVDRGDLTKTTMERFIPVGVSFEEVLSDPKMIHMRELGKLFRVKGTIEGSKMTGQELRGVINREVSDGPIFRILRTSQWQPGVERYLQAAQLDARGVSS